MSWENVPKDIESYEGFVYLITNLINGKKYIGKKFFWSRRELKPLKGKKRKRISIVESDWRDYYGSCNKLNEDIEKYGKENFKREILMPCKTRWDCGYYEAEMQFSNGVLFDDNYYNGIINCRLSRRKGQ